MTQCKEKKFVSAPYRMYISSLQVIILIADITKYTIIADHQ